MESTDPARVKLTDGVLELNDTSVKFPEIRGKDKILRAKLKRLDRDKHLKSNVRNSGQAPQPEHDRRHWQPGPSSEERPAPRRGVPAPAGEPIARTA